MKKQRRKFSIRELRVASECFTSSNGKKIIDLAGLTSSVLANDSEETRLKLVSESNQMLDEFEKYILNLYPEVGEKSCDGKAYTPDVLFEAWFEAQRAKINLTVSAKSFDNFRKESRDIMTKLNKEVVIPYHKANGLENELYR
jgi:hypothetical protein